MIQFPSCTDYITAIETSQLLKANTLQGGNVAIKNGKPLRYAGGFCVVFPYFLRNGKKVAVRCWIAHVPDADKRSNLIATRIKESKLPYFAGFEYIQTGIATSLGVYPIIVMDWVEAAPLKDYLKRHINDSTRLANLAADFKTMVVALHEAGFSHGDLQHGNIMVSESGQITLVDYDSMFVPGLEGVTDDIKGLGGYQHPCRQQLKYLSPTSDYFSELIIYTSILVLSKYPNLWQDLDIENTETLIFSQEDINAPERSHIIHKLKSDDELADCIEAIEDALQITNIEELQPLEEAIVPKSVVIIDGLTKKWNNPSLQEALSEPEVDIDSLSDKWKKTTVKEVENTIDTSSICTKWR